MGRVMASERRNGSAKIQSARPQRGVSARHRAVAGQGAHIQVSAMQRSRLLAGAIDAVGDLGWEDASVARITQRAGVSRRTFYESFENRDECFVAVLESTVDQIAKEISAENLGGLSWRERVRGGLWRILCFFDREPALARMCLVESRRGGGIVLDYRQRTIERLAVIVDQGRDESPNGGGVAALTAHGVIGGVFELVYSRLLNAGSEPKVEAPPLRKLLGEFMGMIVLPYLGVAAARREQARPAPVLSPTDRLARERTAVGSGDRDLLARLPMRLTYRTARVLQAVGERPAQSNRQVGDMVGISDQGQISKLLARLARLGLLTNSGIAGERNQWELTPTGNRITNSIKTYTHITEQDAGHVNEGEAQHAY